MGRKQNSTYAKVALLATIVTLAGVGVALVVINLIGDSSAIDATPATLDIGQDRLAVIQLAVVTGATDNKARDACLSRSRSDNTSQWLIAGPAIDQSTYFCMQQAHVDIIRNSTRSALSTVLQSVHVLEASDCPSSHKKVYSPRFGVVVCTQTMPSSQAIALGMYVSDVYITTEQIYAAVVPGWTTSPLYISSTGPRNATVYLAYKRPVRPISSLVVIQNAVVGGNDVMCRDQLGFEWEQASPEVVNQVMLCIQRQVDVNDTLNSTVSVLVNVTMVPSWISCNSTSIQRIQLGKRLALCATYGDAATVRSTGYIRTFQVWPRDQLLVTVPASRELPIETRSVDDTSPVVLLLYRHRAITLDLTPVHSSQAAAIDDLVSTRPPLIARVETTQDNRTRLAFKILQIADLHFTGDPTRKCNPPPQEMTDSGTPCSEARMSEFVSALLDAEKPDLVVYTGDNFQLSSSSNRTAAIAQLTDPAEARGIPYALVFGNHDDEGGHPRQVLLNEISQFEHSYTQWGPASIQGVGNYELNVYAPDNATSAVFRMYFLDSNGYPNRTIFPGIASKYDWIRPQQVEYYRRLAAFHLDQNEAVPAVMFFHIPTQEYESVGSPSLHTGGFKEPVMPSYVPSDLFSALVQLNDVKATFCGHNHYNDYCTRRHGIQLCFGGGIGFARAYGSATFARRARVIEWSLDTNNNTRMIKSWRRHFGSTFATKHLDEVVFSE